MDTPEQPQRPELPPEAEKRLNEIIEMIRDGRYIGCAFAFMDGNGNIGFNSFGMLPAVTQIGMLEGAKGIILQSLMPQPQREAHRILTPHGAPGRRQ